MKNHTKVYMEWFSFSEGDFIPCEITGKQAVDISHNDPRGMGGSKNKDHIANLMALTREAHNFLETNPKYYWWFHLVHCHYIVTKEPYYLSKAAITDPIFKEIYEKF